MFLTMSQLNLWLKVKVKVKYHRHLERNSVVNVSFGLFMGFIFFDSKKNIE